MKGKKAPKRRARPNPPQLKNKRGHPFALPDKPPPGMKPDHPEAYRYYAFVLSTLEGLGSIQATTKEVAAVLRVSEPTLFAFFRRNPEARDAYVSGKDGGKASLRRNMFALAAKNATMGIFLALNYLGMKDRREIAGVADAPIKHEHSGKVDTGGTVIHDYSKLSPDELARLYAEKVGPSRSDSE